MKTKLIRQIFGGIFFLLLSSGGAMAQDTATAGAKNISENMKEQLALNESQYNQVYSINLDFLQKAIENRDSGKSKIDRAKRLMELDEDRNKKLKSVLSDDQYKKFVATKAENRKKLKEYFKEKE